MVTCSVSMETWPISLSARSGPSPGGWLPCRSPSRATGTKQVGSGPAQPMCTCQLPWPESRIRAL